MILKKSVCAAFSAVLCLLAACGASQQTSSDAVERAFADHQSNIQVTGQGVVSRVLADDTSGLPHQRFILGLSSGKTVLIEHNTDVAPRIDDLKEGDTVEFSGEYIWNDKGGLVHWTHHDPAGRHASGWLKHNGRTYQ